VKKSVLLAHTRSVTPLFQNSIDVRKIYSQISNSFRSFNRITILLLRTCYNMLFTTIFTAAFLATACTTATPINGQPFHKIRRNDGSAASQILEIAPGSASCTMQASNECATAEHAAPFLISAMKTYSIFQVPEIAAVLSLIAFETVDFKYNINHFPGRAGQGTRNMQMPDFNLQYALSIPELKDKAQAITTAGSTTGLGDDKLNAIRELVLPDQYSWASAAWFLTTKCASIRPQLQSGTQAGFEAYMGCVGTTATSDRLAYWNRAKTTFGM
jgi:hypothetical protein